ncbi:MULTISPECIES: CDP-glucose 4,6-dehydratase [Sphingobium]|uniref:CDP-glucose 4,6-dehydratase n=1 Tax=Sphingobium fuliginis (strain ATCC 27551) TaxID=336203 RepID=A0ABQ1ELZ4_SPHSA|nr:MULTISPECIES: CDP-glucose 4,6-dehydratase [Sphingobium]MCB4861150.1 CDP-glucose 4,6-dehydratase [Sphingobium sp. PNB]RYM01433.1 CDP-glucose 4,6-dehydratase [Sphingobium fuliginis]GFZ77959.1 CDP-glucose 4,6-dehydratase [Sphingobium fuliginis]
MVTASFWNGRRILVTGHTGFKGGWLSLWLHRLGAHVTGLSLPPPTRPSFFEQTHLRDLVNHVEGDIRDMHTVSKVVEAARPEIVFHLAAQPLVRYSYANPVETYATNVMGTVHVLEACRTSDSVRAVICVTTDKCYENREWVWPYRENDPMGGYDPYSSSKGAAELAIAAYRRSYPDGPKIASARAGNVIGGGDWAEDRLIPDIIRALGAGERPMIRNPASIRPWQHVLEALSGYLAIGTRLIEGRDDMATAWNFGPSDDDARPVSWIVERMLAVWGSSNGWDQPSTPQPHEAAMLKLDSSKARNELGWKPKLSLNEALTKIVDWHKDVARGGDAREISLLQIEEYMARGTVRTSEDQWA